MKIRFSHLTFLVLSVAFCSFTAPDKEEPDVKDTVMTTANQGSGSDVGANVKNTEANKQENEASADNDSGEPSRSIPIDLILSGLALVAAVAVYLLGRKSLKSQERYLEGRIDHRKTEIQELDGRVGRIEKDIPGRVRAVLQEQQDLFMAEQERKMKAIQEEAAAREEEIRRQQEALEEASKPYVPKVFYATYKESVKGFALDFLTEDKKPKSTVVIKTLSDDKAEFSLVSDLTPTAFRGILDACEIVKGSQESYNVIKQIEPGELRLDDDAWVIVSKVKIACV